MSNSKRIEHNNEYDFSNYDPSQFDISNGILTKYLGNALSVVIPSCVSQISSTAFIGCSNVTEIIIPDSVKAIDRFAFASCAALKSVRMGFGISVVPIGAFAELPELESVILTDCISDIEDFAFKNCKNLREILFLTKKYRDPVNSEEKGKAFEMMIAGEPAKIEYIDILEKPPILKSIGNYSFGGCISLDTTLLSNKAEKIGLSAFDTLETEIENVNTNEPLLEEEASEIEHVRKEDAFMSFFEDDDCLFDFDIFDDDSFFGSDIFDEEYPEDATNKGIFQNDTKEVIATSKNNETYDISSEKNDNVPTKYLIKGFVITDGEIQKEDSQKVIPDAPIESLALSGRLYNAFYRIRESITEPPHNRVMVSDLLKLSPEYLCEIRNMGAKSAVEIIDRLTAYLCSYMTNEEHNEINKKYTIAPDYDVIDGTITHIEDGKIVEDVLIDYIGLSVRAINSLYRGNVVKLSDLICLSVKQLEGFPKMGEKSIFEIVDVVPCYLKENQITKLPTSYTEVEAYKQIKVSIPPLSTQYAVLASDYAVVDGTIYHRKTLKIVPDISVDRLDLSVRSYNCLIRNRNTFVSSLVGMPYSDFRGIRNLGQLSANEIQEKLKQYLDEAHHNSEKQAIPASSVSSEQILDVLHKHEFESLDLAGILFELPDATEKDAKAVLDLLAANEKIVIDGELFGIKHASFFKELNAQLSNNSDQLDERAIRILQSRSLGKTLEEVGLQEGATRERIRQIEKKALDKFTKYGQIIFEEDQFAYLFTTYAFDREFYFNYLDIQHNIWCYLNFRYYRGKKDISDALEDERLPVALRRTIDKYLHRGYIQIEGSYIQMQRADIEDAVAEKYCKDEVSLETFFEYYEKFLLENGITEERLQINESIKSSRSNRLAESNKILWKQNKCLRYYDINGSDFTELLETLNLGQYENVELSTRKFLIDYPDLMKRYDLRDEYEIHNLLKKIHAESENSQMVFCRMPSIHFGVFDKERAVKEILFALAPVSIDDLAEMISLEYGVREDTVKANWLTCVHEYYHQGMYSVEYEDMPEEHVQKLKEVLTDDFYFMAELQKIYRNLVADADVSLLSTYNLKKMGFLVGSSYALQHYSTAEAYFEHLLTSDDIIDIAPINRRYTGLTTYSACLSGLRHDVRIIEFEPYQYINIRRLEKLGITKEKLREYGSQVWSYLIDDEYFTIRSIRIDGFKSELDELGFGDLFYASILKEDGRFSWQRVGNAVVLNPKGESFTVHDFLVDYIATVGSVNVDDFSLELRDKYGIELDRYSIIEKIKGSDVYYDSIMEKLYANYLLYFEEI